jgi:hypothetical protein
MIGTVAGKPAGAARRPLGGEAGGNSSVYQLSGIGACVGCWITAGRSAEEGRRCSVCVGMAGMRIGGGGGGCCIDS